jgi:anti-sigma regulatory factor (Ser/Thr protein kinase)
MEMSLHILSQGISKEKILIMQMAVQSVRDIANNLLEKYRDNQQEEKGLNSTIISNDDLNIERPILLYSLIEEITSQKRYEWLQKSCELSFSFMPSAKSVLINVKPADVKRMVSNLLNNAIEAACDNCAKIHVQLDKVNHFLELRIIDNGIGIPAEKISRFLNGESSKHAGRGFGLSGAKQYMDTLGGKLQLSSQPGKGTTVMLNFIINPHPVWYPDQINLTENDNVVVLDDDVAMQTLWFHRLQSYPVKIHLFTKYNDAFTWIKNNVMVIDKIVLLVDYELAEKSLNGLTLLQHFNVQRHGYLVTSHADEIHIQKEVEKLGVWLIPKTLSCGIPISFKSI